MTLPFNIFITRSNILLIGALILLSTVGVYGQTLKKMTPDVYSQWNKIKNIQMSDSAEVILYSLEREIGDKKMAIYQKSKDTSYFFDRVNKMNAAGDGKYVVFTKSLSYDSLRTLKRKKTAKDKLPKDSLCIYNLENNAVTTIANIEDFKMPEKYSGYCFYTKKLDKNKPIEPVLDSTMLDSLPKIEKKKKEPCEKIGLIIRELITGKEDTVFYVKDYVLSDENGKLAYTQCGGDSLVQYSVHLKDLNADSTVTLIADLHQVAQMSFDKKGKHFAFLGLNNKSEAAQKPYKLYVKSEQDTTASTLNRLDDVTMPKDWVISSDKNITWSDSSHRMFFGIAPLLPVKDTTLLEDEIINVEIWHHDSPRLYTQMEAQLESDRKKSFAVMYDLEKRKSVQLESPEAEKSILSVKGDGRYILKLNALPYQKEVTWNGESRKDFILYDTEKDSSALILTGETGNPAFSPGGRYIYWWSRPDSIWKTFDTQKSLVSILGLWSITRFHDEQNDVPQLANAYGLAGWTNNDEAAIVYDRYDMWKINPLDPFSNIALTDGRAKNQVYRYIKTDPDIEYIDTSALMLLHLFDEKTKSTGYHHLDLRTGKTDTLVSGEFDLTKNVRKAKKSQDLLYTLENFSTFPDLLLTDATFTQTKKISNANPQQAEYGWGTAKPYTWINYRNQKNEGLLFFPPDFDPEKKYPLIVNFYERSSHDLHRHRAPEAHRSTINYSYYTNQGYIIFNPDIKYLTGQPGDDCVNAVESGVESLLKTGYIDEARLALQGHSWGGYQVAYLLTKSERYRCAESGAPVVNMVSAYGGIRWESGMSRMFQYEKQQSRLGATLWENPGLFHKNSPIYEMTNVTTPVLILHNDEDGAVPWYQGIEYYMALRRLNKPAWLLNYNNEPHWPAKWQNRLDFNIRMEQFFKHYLMDGPLPLWMKEGNTPLEKGILNKY